MIWNGDVPLPTFIVIGAAKCGTTALHEYLSAHPQIGMSSTKELRFFVDERLWRRGTHWYAAQFPDADVIGETSPQYTWSPWLAHAPRRIRATLPAVKLLYLVRDPVERVLSQYRHAVDQCTETRPLGVVARESLARPNMYIELGCYASQLAAYLAAFPMDDILVVALEDLAADLSATMSRIYRFLGVDEPPHGHDAMARLNSRTGKKRPPLWLTRALHLCPPVVRREIWRPERLSPVLSRRIRRFVRVLGREMTDDLPAPLVSELQTIFEPEVQQLRRLTGQTFERWARFS